MKTKTYSEEMFELTNEIARREHVLDAVTKFAQQGGESRMSIAVDHGDYEIREAVEGIAREHFPAETIMAGLIRWAQVDLQNAKISLQVRASMESQQEVQL